MCNTILFKINAILEELLTLLTELGECIFKNDAPPLNSNLKLFTAN